MQTRVYVGTHDMVFRAALFEFEKSNAQMHGYRGYSLRRLGEHQKALADFSEAIRLMPKDATPYLMRAEVNMDVLNDYDAAIADCNTLITLKQEIGKAYYYRALCHSGKHQQNRASVDYDEAIRLDPDRADVRTDRAWSYYRRREYQKAVADLNEAIRLRPSGFRAYAYRGAVEIEKNEFAAR